MYSYVLSHIIHYIVYERTKNDVRMVLRHKVFIYFLPLDKHKKGGNDIQALLYGNLIRHQLLETLIGRLNHVAGIYLVM
jgi:hypothetical protein